MTVPRLAALCALLLALLPAAAHADATVALSESDTVVVVETDDDEVNAIRAESDADVVRVTDTAAGRDLVPGDGCTRPEAGVVECVSDTVETVRISLGPGDDRLLWGPLAALLDVAGGDGDDTVDFSARDGDGTIDLRGTDSSAADDFHDDLEHAIGGDGEDFIFGNEGANELDGGMGDDHVLGEGGADEVTGGGGFDVLHGDAGDDRLEAADGERDDILACDEGDDDADHDAYLDPFPYDCEAIRPEFGKALFLISERNERTNFRAGMQIFAIQDDDGMRGQPLGWPADFHYRWSRCTPDATCTVVEEDNDAGYLLKPEDVGHFMAAELTVVNRAGSDTATAAAAEAVLPPEGIVTCVCFGAPPPDYYNDYGNYLDALEQRIGALRTTIGATLRALVRRFSRTDPRVLARRRTIAHRVLFPEAGTLTLTWTAHVAGTRAAAARRLVIARGRGRGTKGRARTIRVKPTRQGRRVLRRARRLSVTLSARFVGGAATREIPAEAKRTFRLKRRNP